MEKANFREQLTADLDKIQALLADSLSTHKEETNLCRLSHDMEKEEEEEEEVILLQPGNEVEPDA